MPEEEEMVSLSPWKKWVRRKVEEGALSPDSLLAAAIEDVPDELPRLRARKKVEFFNRLLDVETKAGE